MQIPQIDDFHVHLRQAELMNLVTPLLEKGGCRLAYVMPNLTPPITTTAQALSYKKSLEELSPSTTFLMTLYLSPSLTREEIKVAHQSGITGVKSYPKGVTTNSESGIEDYEIYYPVFEEMEKRGMVLNLHGEIPSDPDSDVCVMNAEEMFLKHLLQIHTAFPNLKIVLEHVTSKVAVDLVWVLNQVKSLGDTVACTITVHHLELIVDDWAGCSHHFCKPVAKFPRDREALRQVVKEGHPRFFLGTDSAPHPRSAKETSKAAAGVFVTPFVGAYLAHILESFGALDRLEGFACRFGRQFYGIPQPTMNETNATAHLMNEKHQFQKMLVLEKKEMKIPNELEYVNEHGKVASVVPFLAGKSLTWSL